MELGTKLTGKGFINCPSCELLVKEKHSLQMDRLYLSRKLQAIKKIVLGNGHNQIVKLIMPILTGDVPEVKG
jgi:hypothetical protein